jgi:glucosamine--fructose-6-phosphate aminotransferase (isomerizing)
VNFCFGSEFPNYHHFLKPNTLMITISQSGETADVLEAVEVATKEGVKVISLVNVMGSTLDRVSDHTFLINAGPEKAVASTKATTAQLALVTLLAYASAGRLEEGKRLLMETASAVNDMLNPRYEDHIKNLAEKICGQENIYIIGRSLNYPMALESAIKIQEVSYIHAEGFAGGELKHGPIALIGKGTPCIALVANDEVKKDIISNSMEIKSRGGYIIGISPENNEIFDYWIKVPDSGVASPIVNIIPVQILAYHLAVLRGCDPDYPKNLAKSVTVK